MDFDFIYIFFHSLAISWIHETNPHYEIHFDSFFEAFSCTCIASDITSSFISRSIDGADSPQTQFLQRIFLQTELSLPSYSHKHDVNSIAARLGRALIPQMLNILMKYRHDTDILQRCMGHMIHCATVSPSTFSGDVHHLLECCCLLSAEFLHKQDTATCLTVLDFISSLFGITHVQKFLTDHRELLAYCSCGANQFPGLFNIFADIILHGMDYDDLEGWSRHIAPVQEQQDEYWDGDAIAYHGQALLESFLRNAGIDTDLLAGFLKTIEATFFNQEAQQCKEAALRILEACLVAIPDIFNPYLHVALEFAFFHATQGHFRLQYQCVHFIASVCESQLLNANQQKIYGVKIIQCLYHLLHCTCDKVVAKTCFALVTFCRIIYASDNCDQAFIQPILHEVISVLITGPLSNEGNLVTLTHAISAIAALASISAGDFNPFYNRIMPGLLSCASISRNAFHLKSDASNLAALRGAAIEAASIIILSVSVDPVDGAYSFLEIRLCFQFLFFTCILFSPPFRCRCC